MGTLGSVASLLAATLYQGNPDGNHKRWNIGLTTQDAYAAGILLHILVNGRFTMGKIEIISFAVRFRSYPVLIVHYEVGQGMKQTYLYL